MKKIVFALTLLVLATTCYSQTPVTPIPTQEAPKGTREYYLQKRQANMVRGWIFTPGGVVLLGLSFAMAWGEAAGAITTLGKDEANGTGAGLVAVAGVVSIIGGTISFVSAGQNKRKARSMAVGYEQVPLPQQGSMMTTAVPTVGLQIHF